MTLKVFILVALFAITGCARLHSVQISDINNSRGNLARFDIKTSETGVNVSEGAHLAGAVSGSKSFQQGTKAVSQMWALITYGPRIGEVTFSDTYADDLQFKLPTYCSSGRIAGVMTIRETNKYPVISGEIVRVIGYCVANSSSQVKGSF